MEGRWNDRWKDRQRKTDRRKDRKKERKERQETICLPKDFTEILNNYRQQSTEANKMTSFFI